MPGEEHEWIYFSDNAASRGLLIIQHEDDAMGDRYYPVSPMTVFGYGRPSGTEKVLTRVPATYSILFVEESSWDGIAEAARKVVGGSVGAARAHRVNRVTLHGPHPPRVYASSGVESSYPPAGHLLAGFSITPAGRAVLSLRLAPGVYVVKLAE